MGIDEGIYFAIQTPLNVEVRTAVSYWDYLITIKHPVMRGKEDIVKTVLQAPDKIRRLQDRQGGFSLLQAV